MKTPPLEFMGHRRPHAHQGFSLIELLIASAVVGAAAALLIGGLVSTNRSTTLRTEQILTGQLLASQLALLDEEIMGDAPAHGTFPQPLDAFSWVLERSDAAMKPLVQVVLTVTHEGHATHVVTYRRPAPASIP